MSKQADPYLELILEAIISIKQYQPHSETEFLDDAKAQDAILMRLQEVGEQLINIRDKCPEFWQDNSTRDWNRIIGLRNRISHGYREIDMPFIWQILTGHLPQLEQEIKELRG